MVVAPRRLRHPPLLLLQRLPAAELAVHPSEVSRIASASAHPITSLSQRLPAPLRCPLPTLDDHHQEEEEERLDLLPAVVNLSHLRHRLVAASCRVS